MKQQLFVAVEFASGVSCVSFNRALVSGNACTTMKEAFSDLEHRKIFSCNSTPVDPKNTIIYELGTKRTYSVKPEPQFQELLNR